MALFKTVVDEDDLASLPFHEGYAYFCKESSKFYIDIIDENDEPHRVSFNSNAADGLMQNGTYLEAEEIATLTDVSQAASAAYRLTILPSNWKQTNKGNYLCTKAIPTLKCGQNGDIPPIVSPASNRQEYSLIVDAIATAGQGITFIAEEQPKQSIEVVIIDVG